MQVPAGLTTANLVVILLTTLGAYIICDIIYNLYFHPLARFPGPFLWRTTRLRFVLALLKGSLGFDVLELYNQYGPVVRIAPNELAFSDGEAWKNIYGYRGAGGEEMEKFHLFYQIPGVARSFLNENRTNHNLLRKAMYHGFSDRALRQQEPIINEHVDRLIEQLHRHCKSEDGKPAVLDMTAWYNWTTFDIIGDLVFGEPFESLKKVHYDPWVAAIGDAVAASAYIIAMKYLGLGWVLAWLIPVAQRSRKENNKQTQAKLNRRMAINVERPDLIDGILKMNLNMKEVRTNASLLILAGSETTATLLSGLTYLLATNPQSLESLTQEIRSTFESDKEINMNSTTELKYLNACLQEALRRYPPVPIGMPRVVPKGGATIAGSFIPEETVVSVYQWAAHHCARSWTDPFSYKPERFLPSSPAYDRFRADNFDSMQPFSMGSRNCLGRGLAFAEMRLIMAHIVFNFDFELVNQDNWLNQKIYSMWQKPPLEMHLIPRRVGAYNVDD